MTRFGPSLEHAPNGRRFSLDTWQKNRSDAAEDAKEWRRNGRMARVVERHDARISFAMLAGLRISPESDVEGMITTERGYGGFA